LYFLSREYERTPQNRGLSIALTKSYLKSSIA
jgi:hypothetical protein